MNRAILPFTYSSHTATLGDVPLLPSLADRAWHAWHCLPRDSRGKPPSRASLEKPVGLSYATLSKIMLGEREDPGFAQLKLIAKALQCDVNWLADGDGPAPRTTLPIPPRPGAVERRHGELKGWKEAVHHALTNDTLDFPPEAFLAGADLPVFRPLESVDARLAKAVSLWAWETSSFDEQTDYSTRWAKQQESKHVTPVRPKRVPDKRPSRPARG